MLRIVAILGIVSGCHGGSAEKSDAGPTVDATAADADSVTVGVDVMTDRGPVHGVSDGDLVEFRGIPYAADPVGPLRFAPPAEPAPWTTPLDASQFGPACPQDGTTPQAEGCLSINVWAHASGPRRPVIVWVYGGGYVSGASSSPQYDAAALARTGDVDVISFNYRLGVLGFLALPQLAASDTGTGNWGLRDQIAALGWVHRNATAFGGDPTHVMIAGESAGGVSICTLLAAPAAQGLYSAAAIESGSCRPILNLTTTNGTFPAAEGEGVVAAADLGCTSGDIATCLRGKTVAEIMAAQDMLPSFLDLGFPVGATVPVVDGIVLDQRPFAAIAAGRGAVPLILGVNHDDESAFVADVGVTDATGQFAAYLGELPISADASAIEAIYPTATFGELGAAVAFGTDLAFACPTAQLAAAHTGPTYAYELERPVPNGPLVAYGAVHGLDYVYLFGTFSTWGITPSADDVTLSTEMQQAWGAFAYGNPPSTTPAWPTVPSFVGLDTTIDVQTIWRGGRCAMLQSLGILLE